MGQQLKGRPMSYWFGGAYPFCVRAVADLANKWLDANNPGERDLAYVFEAGHENQGDADRLLGLVSSDVALGDLKRRLRYFSHAFMDGKRRNAGALQAADLLAWHLTDGYRRGALNETGRRIVEQVPIYYVHYPGSAIMECLRGQLEFCNFYADLKHAKRL